MYKNANIFRKGTPFLDKGLYKSDAVSHQKSHNLTRIEASLFCVTGINCGLKSFQHRMWRPCQDKRLRLQRKRKKKRRDISLSLRSERQVIFKHS